MQEVGGQLGMDKANTVPECGDPLPESSSHVGGRNPLPELLHQG